MPDATTVWLFRERLVQAKAIDKLFACFDAALTDRGYLAMGGHYRRDHRPRAQATQYRFTSHIHQRKPLRRPTPERIARANAKRPAIRSVVEHVFAGQKHRMGLIVRTIGIAPVLT